MKAFIFSLLYACAIVLLINGCTSDSGNPVGGGNEPQLDEITRNWVNYYDSSNTFFFVTFDSMTTRGVFWGNTESKNVQYDLCGFFDKSYVEFDVKLPDGRIKYKGNFINSDKMELDSAGKKITLVR